MSSINIISGVGVGIIATILAIFLKQYHKEYAIFVSLGAALVILAMVVMGTSSILSEIRSYVALLQVPMEYGQVIFKALGVCFIAQLATDACNDAGESAIASKIEMGGKIAILVVSLPLFRRLLDVVVTLIRA